MTHKRSIHSSVNSAFLLAWTAMFLCACSGPEKNPDQLSQSLSTYFQQQIQPGQPGAAVLIVRNDSVIFSDAYGIADLETKTPIDSQTLFNLGSISKTFVANAILILQEEHKLSIEDSIFKYFPDFKNKSIAKKVRIKHLLSHTSGLPDNRPIARDSVFYLSAKDAENWYPITQADKLNFEPGEQYEYSNPAYNGLALIVEKISGMKWQKFIEERIFKPSGMTKSTITNGAHPESGVAHGYTSIDGRWMEDDYGEEPTFAAAGNGGVWSSTSELMKYERALREHVFLKEETIAASRSVFVPENWKSKVPPAIGWSWFIEKRKDGLETIGHKGTQGGFECQYVTVPDQKIHIIILCNAPCDTDAFIERVFATKALRH